MDFRKITPEDIKTYRNEVLKSSSASTFDRKMFSLKKFFEWAVKEGYMDENPVEEFIKSEQETVETKLGKIEKQSRLATPSYSSAQARIIAKLAGKPKLQKLAYNVFYTRPNWYKSYHSLPIANYFNYAILILLMTTLGFGVYNQFFKTTAGLSAYPTTLTTAGRYLSFQGRLTNKFGNPITIPTNLDFKLYNASSSGTPLWDSGACSITPDTDGVFSTLLGSSCGTEIGSSVFSENPAVWLGVTVGTDTEATPRVQIATVAYALNSQTLQGYPASESATANTVPVMNSLGQIVLGAASPKIQSTSGNFAIQGQTMTFTTPTASNGNITVAPDGTGVLNLTFTGSAPGGSAKGFVNATDTNLTSGSLYYGAVASGATGYSLLQLQSGSTLTNKFVVDYGGNMTASGTINGLTISSGTISGGIWTGTTIGTGYGGTGQNWSGVAQGSLPYFNGTGTMATLGPGTSGYALVTQGAGQNPTWANAATLGTNYWQLNSGILSPNTISNSLNLGATATASATVHLAGTVGENSFINTGNVGIGTTNPGQKLVIAKDITSLGLNGNYQLTLRGVTNPAQMLGLGYDTTNSRGYISAGIQGSSYSPLILQESGGNVGIGTTNPGAKLQISSGNILLDNNQQLQGKDTGGTARTLIMVDGNNFTRVGSTGLSDLYLDVNNIAGAIIAKATTGDIGIGDNSPDARLEISANGGVTDLFKLSSDDGNDGDLFVVKNSGNVGIGTTSPTGKLHISGTTDDQQLIVQANSTQTTNLTEWQNSGGTLLASISPTGSDTATLGSELITNGNFDSDLSGWTASDWTWSSGTAAHSAGTTTPITQNINLTNGTTYQVTVTVARTAGTLTLTFGSLEGSYGISSSTTYTQTFKATATAPTTLTFTPNSTFAGSIDSVSVKAITAGISPDFSLFNTDGSVGFEARSGGAGLNNSYLGYRSGYYNTTGSNNSAQGMNSLYSNTTGNWNSAQGTSSLFFNTTGYNNSAQGYASLLNLTGAHNNNTAIGAHAGRYYNGTTGSLTAVDNSLFLGSGASALNATGDTNEIVIGYNAIGLGSNSVVLGNDSITTTALKGNVGIGLTNPTYKLDVSGDVNITGAFRDNGSAGTSGQVLSTTGTGVEWIDAAGVGTNFWQLANHVLAPANATDYDLAVGGNSTSSAKLLINAATGNITSSGTASVSGNLTLGYNSALQSAYGPLTLNYKSGANTWNPGLTVDDITGNVGIGTNNPGANLAVPYISTKAQNLIQAGGSYTVGGSAKSPITRSLYYEWPAVVGVASTGTINVDAIDSYGFVGVMGVGGNSGGGRSNVGVYGYSQHDNPASNPGNKGYGGIFTADVINGATTFNGGLYGLVSKADTGGGSGSTASVYGIYSTGIGSTSNTVYGGYFSGTGGTTNYGLYSAAGTNYFNGNTGIGTPSPLAKLDVNGTASVSGNLSFSGARSIVGTAMNPLTLGDSNTGTIQFYSASNKIDSSGNLTLAGTTTFGGLTYTWPSSQTTDGFLKTNGSGGLSWTTTVPATSVPFSGITGGTNTTAAMVVGAGSSLTYSGGTATSGVINANQLLGGTWAIPGAIGSTTPNTGAFTTLTSTGATTLGNNTATVAISSNDWDISTTGDMAGIGAIAMNGAITGATGFNGLVVTPNTGVITTGTWNGTAIGTGYGGTGQNWSGVAQGSLPYFNGTGTMTTLGPGTSGYALVTQGAGQNPTWANAATLGTNYWQLNAGALSPANISNSLNLGATATASATVHLAGTVGENSFINTGNVGIGTTTPGAKLSLALATTAVGGIDFGGDVNLYRSAANVLKTDDTFNAVAGLQKNGISVIAYGDLVYNSETFLSGYTLQVPEIWNLLQRGESRYTINQTGFSTFTSSALFNGNYDESASNKIDPGATAVLTVDFLGKGEYDANGVVYPQGYVYIHSYKSGSPYTPPQSVSGRYLDKNGTWHNLTNPTFIGSNTWQLSVGQSPYMVTLELSIVGDPTDGSRITEIDYFLTRQNGAKWAVTNKYNPESLYSAWNWKDINNLSQVQINPSGISYFNGGNVGIGTTNPVSQSYDMDLGINEPTKLDIDGALHLTAGSGYYIGHEENFPTRQGGSHFTYDDTTNKITIGGFKQGVGRSSLLLNPNGGNVGIGTTSPTAKLDVNGNVNITGYATASGSLALGNATAALGPGHLNMSGNLTVGGTTGFGGLTYTWPSSQTTGGFLQTNGTGTLSWATTVPATSVPFSGITGGTNTTAAMVVGAGSSLTYSGGTATSGVINANQLLGGTWAIPGAIGSTTANTGAFTTLSATGNITTSGDLAVNGGDITSTVDLTINPAGGQVMLPSSVTLNVGGLTGAVYNAFAAAGDTPAAGNIGASNDLFVGGDFEVKGGLYLTGRNIYNNSVGTILFPTDPLAIDSYYSLTNGSWLVNNTKNPGIAALMVNQVKGGDIFTASASGSPKFVIKNNGYVGIGTTDPSVNLEVRDTYSAQIGIGDSAENQSLWIGASNITGSAWVWNQGNTPLVFATNNTEKMRIAANGYVGIGTTNPSSTLTLESTSENTIRFTDSENLRAIIGIAAGGGQITTGSVDNDLVIRNQLGKIMFTTDGGLSNSLVLDGSNASVSGTLTLGNGTTNAIQSAYGPLTLNYKLGANTWAAGLTVDDMTGNVGIGTTSPTAKLYIESDAPTGFAYSSEFYDGGSTSCIAGTYTARITAIKNGVESSGSQQVIHTMVNVPNYSIVYTWNSVPGATAYRIYVASISAGDRLTRGYYQEVAGTQTTASHYCSGIYGDIPNTPVMYANGNIYANENIYSAGDASISGNLTLGYSSALQSAYGPLTLNYKTGIDTWAAGLTVDDMTGNVGVGTTSPDVALDVNGAAVFRGNVGISNDGSISALGDQESMVPNSGFEVDNDNSSNIPPDGWMAAGKTGNEYILYPANITAQGEASLEFGCNGTTCNSQTLLSSCIPVTRSQSYNVYYKARDNAVVSLTANFRYYADKSDCISDTTGALGGGTNVVITAATDLTNSFIVDYGASVANGSGGTWAKIVYTLATDASGEYIVIDSVKMSPSSNSTSIDLAENYLVDSPIDAGYLVSPAINSATATVQKSPSDSQSIIGIISTKPGITLGAGIAESVVPVALAGRVPAIVSTKNGSILIGDHVTTSDISGVGAKQFKSGFSVGTALEGTSSWSDTSCKPVASLEDITWPADDGTNTEHPCFILPDNTLVGKIMVAINITWYDPMVYLTDTGNINITTTDDGSYKLTDSSSNNSVIDRVAAYAEAAIANLRAGLINAIDITATGTINAVNFVAENISAGAANVQDLAAGSFTAFQGTVDNMLISSGLVAGNIQTKMISPLADTTDVTIQVGSASQSGKLAVQNSAGTEVASIDSEGNATFSGTLYADSINSKSLDDMQALLTQVKTDQDLLAQAASWNVNTATDSATISNDQLAISNLYVTNQAAINSLSVSNTLTVGSDLVFQSTIDDQQLAMNSIDTLSSPLRIQSLAMAPIEMMAGLIKIDTAGNVQIAGNLAVVGKIESAGLSLKDNQQSIVNNEQFASSSALLTLQNASGNTVSAIDASGSASFANISTQGLTIAGAVEATNSAVVDGVITTNASAGSGVIPTGLSEITIKNNSVTDYTLVYVTPTSSTNNYVLYVKSKAPGEFVVGFTNPIDIDVNFNWWVVKVGN